MKELVKKVVLGRNVWISVLLVAGIIFTAAFACETGGDKVPPDNELQSLVKDTTSDFTNAVDTGDFSNLHSKASSDFQSTYTVSQTKDAFQTYVDKKDTVLPSLKNASSTTATFSPTPSIRSEKGLNVLVVSGEFAAKPYPVKFEYEYVWHSGSWKMLKLVVKM